MSIATSSSAPVSCSTSRICPIHPSSIRSMSSRMAPEPRRARTRHAVLAGKSQRGERKHASPVSRRLQPAGMVSGRDPVRTRRSSPMSMRTCRSSCLRFPTHRRTPARAFLAATLFARDLTTGNSVLESGAGGTGAPVVASVYLSGGLAGTQLLQADVTAQNPTPPVQVQVTTLTGQVYSFGANLSSAAGTRHRVSWRYLK